MDKIKVKALILLGLYLIPRFIFSEWWMQLPLTLNFGLEFSYVLLILFLYKSEFKIEKSSPQKLSLYFVIILSLGALTRYFAPSPVPIRIQSLSIIFQLLLIAPILEESLFRWTHWILLEKLFKSKKLIIFITSFLFSTAHLLSIQAVPSEFRNFIFYQGAYTFILALALGYIRSQSFILSCIALHFAFNLGFGISSYIIDARTPPHIGSLNKVKILVVDMPVDFDFFKTQLKANFLQGDSSKRQDLQESTCSNNINFLNNFLNGKIKKINNEEKILIQKTLEDIHGYHILGLLLNYAPQDSELFFVAAQRHSDPKKLPDPDDYIKTYIKDELDKIDSNISKQQAQIVQLASSDSWDENFSDYKEKGFNNLQAAQAATQIMEAWKASWTALISKHPKTLFVVSAGNGGIDGIGDPLSGKEAKEVLPASLKFSNIIRVASYGIGSGQWSAFSNFSNEIVNLAAPGEDILSSTGCTQYPEIALDGTSQASALVSAFLGHVIAQNRDPIMALQELPLEKEWKEKSIEGRFLPTQ
jgi:hypothetical protein